MYMRDYCARSSIFVLEHISVAIEAMLAMNVRTWWRAALASQAIDVVPGDRVQTRSGSESTIGVSERIVFADGLMKQPHIERPRTV